MNKPTRRDARPAAAATGVFCEARSVGCCKNNTNSRYCGMP